MAGLDLNKNVAYPAARMVKGVCAGIAQHLDVPVKLVRLITVLAMIFGLFSLSGGLHHFDFCSGSDTGQRAVRS